MCVEPISVLVEFNLRRRPFPDPPAFEWSCPERSADFDAGGLGREVYGFRRGLPRVLNEIQRSVDADDEAVPAQPCECECRGDDQRDQKPCRDSEPAPLLGFSLGMYF